MMLLNERNRRMRLCFQEIDCRKQAPCDGYQHSARRGHRRTKVLDSPDRDIGSLSQGGQSSKEVR